MVETVFFHTALYCLVNGQERAAGGGGWWGREWGWSIEAMGNLFTTNGLGSHF